MALRNQGVEFVHAASNEELARWHGIADEAVVRLRGLGVYSDALIDAILDSLADFRSRGANGG